MKYTFNDLLHNVSQVVKHERHMIFFLIWSPVTNAKPKFPRSTVAMSSLVNKRTSKQWTRLLLMERNVLAILLESGAKQNKQSV